MAGDWIKAEHGLENKPEVIRMAGMLGIDRFGIAARWLAIWSWADKVIPETDIPLNGSAFVCMSPHDGDNIAFIDTLIGTPNFANTALVVGWIHFRNGQIEFPNFGRHNGETAKTRARNQRNQKRKRQNTGGKSCDAEPDVVTKVSPLRGDKLVTRGEESREEKKDSSNEESTSIPPSPFDEVVSGWNAAAGKQAKIRTLTDSRRKHLKARLSDDDWRWREALAKFPLPLCESDPTGWQPDFDWFIKPDSVTKILEGKYDWKKQGNRNEHTIGPGQRYDPAAKERDPSVGTW